MLLALLYYFFKTCIFNNRTEMFLIQSASYCDNLIVIKLKRVF